MHTGNLELLREERRVQNGSLEYVFQRFVDPHPSIDYLKARLLELHPPDSQESRIEMKDLRSRIRSYQLKLWKMIGISVEIYAQTKTNWAVKPLVGRAALFGIESDAGETYLQQVEEELLGEALADLDNLRVALAS